MMQPVIQQLSPLQLTHDKTNDLGAHASHGKGFSLNMTNIQRLSMLENWRQHYVQQQGGTSLMMVDQNQTACGYDVVDDCDVIYHSRVHGSCSNHGPFADLDLMMGYDRSSQEYTPLPIPAQLTVQSSGIPGDSLGVFSTGFITKGVRMGPYEGRRIPVDEGEVASNTAYAWEVQHKGNRKVLVDGEDPAHSNWMRYVKCARHSEEQNVVAYQCFGNVYFKTIMDILPKSELLVWYDENYAKNLGVPLLNEGITKFYCQCCGESFKAKKTFHLHQKTSTQCTHSKEHSGNHSVDIQDPIKKKLQEPMVCHTAILDGPTPDSASLDPGLQVQNGSQQTEPVEKTEPMTLLCPFCAKQVGHCSYLKGDMVTCNNCSNSFSQAEPWPHEEDQIYSCDQCNRQFSQKKAFSLHLKTHSGSPGQNQCTLCSKVFTRASNLLRHMRIHSGDRPYSCEQCDKAFRSRSNLQQHLVTHSAVKPFKCEYCGKSFSRVNNLQRHLRIHTGDRPYKCTHCTKSFIQSSHLRKHSRTHSVDKSEK